MAHPMEGGRRFPFGPGPGSEFSRRDFLKRSAATAAAIPAASAILAACGKRPAPIAPSSGGLARPNNPITFHVNQNLIIPDGMPPEQGPLKVYNWEQYIRPNTIDEAQKALGVKIELTTFNTMSEAIAKLTTANLQFDVFMGVTKDVISRLVAVGLLRPLNHSYLPNISNVWSTFTDPGKPFWDVGQNYTVPYTVYTTGIGYRFDPNSPNSHIRLDVSNLRDVIPNMKDPYDIFWDTSWKPYVHLLDDYRDAMTMAMLRRGVTDINTDNPSTREKIITDARDDLVKGVKTMNWQFDVSEYRDVPEGQAYIHQGWSGDFVYVPYYYPKWSPKSVISYWHPPDGKGEVGGDHLTVLAAGQNPVLAHQFLNYMLDFDNAMKNFTWNGYQPPMKQITNPDSLLAQSKNPLTPYNVVPEEMPLAVVSQSDVDNGYQALELSPDVDALWKSAWEAVQNA